MTHIAKSGKQVNLATSQNHTLLLLSINDLALKYDIVFKKHWPDSLHL